METRNDVQSRRLSLIDVSSEDDSLIAAAGNPFGFMHSVVPEEVESLKVMTGTKLENTTDSHEQRVMGHLPIENLEVSVKSSKYNLRKSLAWDSAFFTSAGVLEAEELSNIMESVDRSEKQVVKLPKIQEDVNRSCDSLSSLSDSLESLETDLFEDIRASIQKSSNKSTVGNGSNKLISGGSQLHTFNPSKTKDMTGPNKMKLTSCCKNPSTNMQVSRMRTKNPSCPQVTQKNVARSEQFYLSKQSKVLHKSGPSSVSSKKDTLDDLHAKTEKDSSKHTIAGRRVGAMSKIPIVSESHAAMPKHTVSTKPSSGSSIASKSRSSSSSSLAANSSGNGIGTSLYNTVKKKVDAAGGILPLSNSSVNTTSRFALRNKMQPEITDPSVCLKSVSKLSPCTSPTNSISEWSSDSSASTSSTVKQKSNSRTSFDSNPGLKAASDTHLPNFSGSQNLGKRQSLEGKRKQDKGYNIQRLKNAPAEPLLPPGPTKPSGLRLPSPKIGFFDGAKPLARTPSGGMQSHTLIPGGSSKGGGKIIPSGQQNTAKFGKLQPARSATAIKTLSSDNQQSSVIVKPKAFIPLQSSDAVVEASSAFENHKSDETSMVVHNEVPLTTSVGTKDILGDVPNNDMLYPDQGSTKENEIMDSSLDKMNRDMGSSQMKDVIALTSEGKCEEGISSVTCYDNSGDNQIDLVKALNTETEEQGQVASDLNIVPDQNLHALINKVNPENNSMQSKDKEGNSNGLKYDPCMSSSPSNIRKISESPFVGKVSLSVQPDLRHYLRSFNGTNDHENDCCESQVDSLTGQVQVLPVGSEIPKEISSGNSNKECNPDKSNWPSVFCKTMSSPVVDKESARYKLDILHDTSPSSATDVQKNHSDKFLIDCLSSQLEVLAISTETGKEIVAKCRSPSNITLQTTSDFLDSSKKLLDSTGALLSGSHEEASSPGSATVDVPICQRPLIVKDSLGNGEGICNMPAGPMVTELKMNSPLPQNILKEKNSSML